MFDYVNYTSIEGPKAAHDVEVYALSTCGFCKRALAFLKDNGIKHRYIHVDMIPFETKTQVKSDLRARFHEDISFPYAVIDGTTTLIGFIESDWRTRLLEEGRS